MTPPWVTHSLARILNCTCGERELSSSIRCSLLPNCGCDVTSYFKLPPSWLYAWQTISLVYGLEYISLDYGLQYTSLDQRKPFLPKVAFVKAFYHSNWRRRMKMAGFSSRNFVLQTWNSPGNWALNDGLLSGAEGKRRLPNKLLPRKTMNTWSPESNNLYPLVSLPQGQPCLPDLWTRQHMLQNYSVLPSSGSLEFLQN